MTVNSYESYSRKDNRAELFPYINLTDLDLSEYQIYTTPTECKDNCFMHAVIQHGYKDIDYNLMRMRMQTRKMGLRKLDDICIEFKLHVVIHDLEQTNGNCIFRVNGKKYFGVDKDEAIHEFSINCFKGHYFIDNRTKYTIDYIKHKYVLHEDIDPTCYNKIYDVSKTNKWRHRNEPRRFISSGKLIKTLFENGYFKPITYNDARVLSTTVYKDLKPIIDDLSYNEKFCTKLVEDKHKKIKVDYTYFYADFEADVSTNPHRAYMCCVQSEDGNNQRTFKGEDCVIQLLNYLSKQSSPYVFFHNLKYDFSFIAKHGISGAVKKGTRLYKARIEYNGKMILFGDTCSIITFKLADLPSMFHIEGIQKEIFPYKYYTMKRLKTNKGVISEVGHNEDTPWNDDDYKLFNDNINRIPNCRISENTFDMYKYAEFYCQQDVSVLRLCFKQFCDDFIKETNIDPHLKLTASSLAYEAIMKNVIYPNGNLFMVGGHVRHFMSRAIYGGRCMCAYNKKWRLKGDYISPNGESLCNCTIVDYDAVSLYPSAMARLYIVEGRPEVLKYTAQHLESIPDELAKYSAFVVEIEIIKVCKHYPFPLIVKRTADGNYNTDRDEDLPIVMVVDDIFLEDLIEFQHITFNLIRGYVWTGKKDYRIQSFITKMFNKRLEYKQQGNSLEQIYKLIMNSCYGKCIEKPHPYKYKYVRNETVETKKRKLKHNPYIDFILKHYTEIVEMINITDSTRPWDEDGDIFEIKYLKPIDDHFNLSLFGIHILSMAKRIMNEVMCLAYDIGCHIFYQDTDSMHIYKDDLDKLEKAYEQKYNRKLCGNQLGQFHEDFPNDTVAIESVFLGKKSYIDKLKLPGGEITYHARMKGITQAAIAGEAKRCGGFMELYDLIYNGRTVRFDLTEGRPSFIFNKDFSVANRKEFMRCVKTDYEEGDIRTYFE